LVGCETAHYLAEKGKRVTIIEVMDELAIDVTPTYKRPLLEILAEIGISMFTGVKSEEIVAGGMIITTKRGEKKTLQGDTIVLAVGSKPNSELFDSLRGKVKDIYIIGDCVSPRRIGDAVSEGFRAGFMI